MMVMIPLWLVGVVGAVLVWVLVALGFTVTGLERRVDDMNSEASRKLRESILSVGMRDNRYDACDQRITRLERFVCHKAGLLEMTENSSKIDVAHWINTAQKHGWIKE